MPFATKARRKGFSKAKEEIPYDVEPVNRSIENARLRIQDAGYDPGDSDTRNAFEKFTNLPQKQNAFFDALELLSRPGQAVLNVLDKGPEQGEDVAGAVGRAAWRGFAGRDRVRGSEVVEKMGVTNPIGKAVLGTGLEIVTDPLSLVPVGALAKGVSKVAKPAFKGFAKGYKAIEPQAVRSIRESTIQPALERGKEALGRAFVPDYKLGEDLYGRADETLLQAKQEAENRMRFMTEESMRKVADTAKLAGGIETGADVGRIMESGLKQFEDVKAYEFPDGVRITQNKQDLLDTVKINQERIKELGKSVGATGQEYQRTIGETADLLAKVDNQIRRQYFSRENAALRQLTKRKNQPLNIDELAQSKAFEQVSASPKFNYLLKSRDDLKNQLDDLRAQAEKAKSGGISEIGKLTDETTALRESVKNPVIIQQEIQRQVRELSDVPQIRQAAENLIQSNTELRQWVTEQGIPVGELQGYMTHVLAAEERKRRKNLKALPIDRGSFGVGQPNKKVVSQRELMGSTEDINEQMRQRGRLKEGETFFEPNAFFATAIGQKRLIEYANATKFRREVLSDPNFAQKYEKGMEIPSNAVVIDTNNYKFLSDEAAKELGLADEIGGEYVTTKSVKQALDRYKKLTTDEGINSFVKAFDTAQSFWKRTTLFSLPYHLRNAMGAMFNNYVGGMNPVSLAKYTGQSYPEVYNAVIKGEESALFREFREQGLGSTSLSGVEFARRGEDAEKAIERTIKKRSQFDATLGGRIKAEFKDLKNPMNAFETSRDFGDFIDQTNRFALYKWSKDKGLDAAQAAKKVREVQFDYSKTTPFEREIATRAIPFYRWMRNNLPFQIRQFVNDPRKYANINKLRLNATEAVGIEDEDVPDWMKEQFAIPVYGEGGQAKALGLNLPLADLTKLSSPLQMLLNSITPLAKTPAELAMNRSTFYDRPIQEFAGQERQLSIPSNILGIPIPGGGKEFTSAMQPNETLAYLLEQLGGQPTRQLMNLLASPKDEDQAKKFKDPVLGISSVLKDIDPNKSKFFQQRDELQALMDLMDYIEQQTGSRPRGVNDIR